MINTKAINTRLQALQDKVNYLVAQVELLTTDDGLDKLSEDLDQGLEELRAARRRLERLVNDTQELLSLEEIFGQVVSSIEEAQLQEAHELSFPDWGSVRREGPDLVIRVHQGTYRPAR